MTSLRLVTEGGKGDLEALLGRFKRELSELTAARLLHQAKAIYEELHPETRHGGDRVRRLEGAEAEGGQVFTDGQKRRMKKQAARMAAWPAFVKYAADQTNISQRTIYRRLEAVEVLGSLDPEAERLLYGTKLTTDLSLLVRIARVPKPELHRDLVNIFTAAGAKKMKTELARWEDVFQLTQAPKKVRSSAAEPVAGPIDGEGSIGELAARNQQTAANFAKQFPRNTIPLKFDARVALEADANGYHATVWLRGRQYMIRIPVSLREVTFLSQHRMDAIAAELKGGVTPASPSTPPGPPTAQPRQSWS